MKKLFILGLVLFALSACAYRDLERQLNSELEAWQAQGIQNYSYYYRVSCFCLPTYGYVYVTNGDVVAVEISGTNYTDVQTLTDFPTIEGMFSKAYDAISYGADSIEVDFNTNYHFPASIGIDYERYAIDDEVGYSVTQFQTN